MDGQNNYHYRPYRDQSHRSPETSTAPDAGATAARGFNLIQHDYGDHTNHPHINLASDIPAMPSAPPADFSFPLSSDFLYGAGASFLHPPDMMTPLPSSDFEPSTTLYGTGASFPHSPDTMTPLPSSDFRPSTTPYDYMSLDLSHTLAFSSSFGEAVSLPRGTPPANSEFSLTDGITSDISDHFPPFPQPLSEIPSSDPLYSGTAINQLQSLSSILDETSQLFPSSDNMDLNSSHGFPYHRPPWALNHQTSAASLQDIREFEYGINEDQPTPRPSNNMDYDPSTPQLSQDMATPISQSSTLSVDDGTTAYGTSPSDATLFSPRDSYSSADSPSAHDELPPASPNITLAEAQQRARDKKDRFIQGPDGKIHEVNWNGRTISDFAGKMDLPPWYVSNILTGNNPHRGYQLPPDIEMYPPLPTEERLRIGREALKNKPKEVIEMMNVNSPGGTDHNRIPLVKAGKNKGISKTWLENQGAYQKRTDGTRVKRRGPANLNDNKTSRDRLVNQGAAAQWTRTDEEGKRLRKEYLTKERMRKKPK